MNHINQCKPLLYALAAFALFSSCSKGSSKSSTPTSGSMVTTIAGTGAPGAVNGVGTAASFNNASGIVYNGDGGLYVADFGNSLMRTLDLTSFAVGAYAGTGTQGFLNGAAASAEFNGPTHVIMDNQGDLFISDEENNAIREITASGIVSTVAGSGTAGYQDGPAATAMFWHPAAIVMDASGNIYVADGPNNVIRKITLSTGMVSTYAGTGTPGLTNGPAASATFTTPYGLAMDASGNIYVCDDENNCIREINVSTGMVSTYAGSGAQGLVNGAASSAEFYNPLECIFDNQGNLYVSDYNNNVIRKVSTSGTVSTYAGNGTQGLTNGAPAAAEFNHPIGLAFDPGGNLYVADERNSVIRKISAL